MITTEYDFTDENIEIKVFGSRDKSYEIHFGDKFCLWGNEKDLRLLAQKIDDVLSLQNDIAEVYQKK